MQFQVRGEAIFVIRTLVDAGYQAYLVGGAVRDLLLGTKKIVDYDFATNANPEQILSLFPEAFYENEFGTVMITPDHLRSQMGVDWPSMTQASHEETPTKLIDLKRASKVHSSLESQAGNDFSNFTLKNHQKTERNFEITTFRSDNEYIDHRRPSGVTWGKTIDQDLERRDFTINAIALAISNHHIDEQVMLSDADIELIDPFAGVKDLASGLIKTVGDSQARFGEDALRMLRSIRFSVQLGFEIHPETYHAIKVNSSLISHVSFERIRDEFLKMLISKEPKKAILMLDETGLLPYIIPELLDTKNVNQGGHHTTDVWVHSLDALQSCPSRDPIVRLATLCHDISKPESLKIVNGQPTFYNHEVIGARVAKNIAKRLRLSSLDQNRMFTLVRFHMFHYQPQNTDASIRRFMRKVGLENIDDILDLREGDRLGSGARQTSWRLEEMKQRMIEQLNQPLDVTDLAINGHDLIDHLGMKPGPKIGQVLTQLFEIILDQPELNQREKLLEKSRELSVDA